MKTKLEKEEKKKERKEEINMSYYSCFSCSKDKNVRHGTNYVDKCSTAYEELLDPNTPKKKALKQYNFLLSSCAHIYDYQKVEYAKNLRNELSKI